MTVSPAFSGWLRADNSLASHTSGSEGMAHHVPAVAFAHLLVG